MRAHPGGVGQSGQCYLALEISLNVFDYSIQAGSRKAIRRLCNSRRTHSIITLKMHSERTEQGVSEEPATRETTFQICFECAKNVLNLRIRHSPLSNELCVASCVIVGERMLQQLRFEIDKDSLHRLGEGDRVLGTS